MKPENLRTAGLRDARVTLRDLVFPCRLCSQNIPHLLGCVAELAASHTGTETVVADGDGIVLEGVGKVIVALGHGTDKDGDTLAGAQGLDVVLGADNGGLETHSHLTAVRGQVVGNGVLDDLEQLLLGIGGTNGQAV